MRRAALVLTVTLCISLFASEAQTVTTWPKTLLWRISGNGLSKNSFLYGTMHLQDKRLFYFSDSLYHYLESAEGYALEVDLQEFMDSLMQKVINEKVQDYVDKSRFKGKDRKKVIDSLINNVRKFNDKSSKKQLQRLRDEKLQKAIKNKEMPTIMDAYLYGIARRQGKWVGGVEDVEDQLTLSDELGADVSADELMMPESEWAKGLEQMINVYLSADLNTIEEWTANRHSSEMKDMIFLQRNLKMARRMDSLAQVRSMFFTVGAAHLPGDSGVINLLLKKGYRVEPVFSRQNLDPVKYAAKLNEIPWVEVMGENESYTVMMPGKASDIDVFGGALKLKMNIDITTMTFFMTGSFHAQENTDLEKLLTKFSENTGGIVLSQKKLAVSGGKGIEADVSSEGSFFRAQYLLRDNTIYMVLTGGEKKEILESPQAKRFLQSFRIGKSKRVAQDKDWVSFGLDEKAFTIQFPDTPKRNGLVEKKAEGTNWSFTIYDYMDGNTGMYYMVQVRDLEPGYYLTGDSIYFASFRENFSKVVSRVTREERTLFDSFPAYHFEGVSEDNDIVYKTLNINRGNRVYSLFAGGSVSPASEAFMEKFLSSFRFTPYKKSEWKKVESEQRDFFTTLPGMLKRKTAEDTTASVAAKEEDEGLYYISHDENESVSYHIFKTPVSPYYWVANDSLFFDAWGRQYKGESDSVLSKATVSNGGLKATEWVIQMPDNNVIKKLRQVLNGDTVYTLISFLSSQQLNAEPAQRFFEDFRIVNEVHDHSIFKSKAELICKDLQSRDSATFAEASEAVRTSAFSKEDLPFLHEALLKEYPDDSLNEYGTARERLVGALDYISDSSTVDFVKEHFNRLGAGLEARKMELLDVLARQETGYSYSVLKELLLEHTPKETAGSELSYRITDSLALTKILFPEILSLTRNSLFAERIIDITKNMLDSNLVTVETLRPYRANFLHTADTILANIRKKEADTYEYGYLDMLSLLAAFNDKECSQLLQQYLRLDKKMLKQEAAIGLLRNAQPVAAIELDKLAADRSYRRDLYDNLKKINKSSFFPGKYKTQKLLAESDIYYMASDDDEPTAITHIGERTATYKGKKYRFHLFQVSYSYENENGETVVQKYLGIAGGYSLDVKSVEILSDITSLYYSEEFDSKKIDKQLKDYLQSMEAYSPGSK